MYSSVPDTIVLRALAPSTPALLQFLAVILRSRVYLRPLRAAHLFRAAHQTTYWLTTQRKSGRLWASRWPGTTPPMTKSTKTRTSAAEPRKMGRSATLSRESAGLRSAASSAPASEISRCSPHTYALGTFDSSLPFQKKFGPPPLPGSSIQSLKSQDTRPSNNSNSPAPAPAQAAPVFLLRARGTISRQHGR